MQKQYYSLEEVANILNLSYMTIYRWVHSGKLAAFQVGRKYRVSSSNLKEFIDSGEKIDLKSASKSLSKFIGSGMMDYAYIESRKFNTDLSLGVNPLGCSSKVLDYYHKKDINFTNYSQVTSQALQKKISAVYGFSQDEILIGAGASDLLQLCFTTFINPDEEVIIPELTFPSFEFLAILTHAQPIFIPTSDDFDLNYSEIPKLIVGKSKLVVLCNPNNPTGQQLNIQKIEEQVVENPKLVFVIDEANIDFGGKSLISLVNKYKNIVVLRSFSKGFGLAGLRVGFALGNKDLIYAMRRRQTPFSVGVFAQKLAEVSLEDLDFLKKTKSYMQTERKYLEHKLKVLGYKCEKSDSNYLLVDISNNFTNSASFLRSINKNNANVVSGDDFRGLNGKYIRLSPRTHEVNERFVEILGQLGK